jgi:hypothetical protein
MIKPDDEQNCKRNIVSKSASKIVYEETCTGENAYKSTVKLESRTPESISANFDMVRDGGGGKRHVDIKGKWLGSSCAGIKDKS